MICPKCKKEVSDEASFCTDCGTALKENEKRKNLISFLVGIFTNPVATIESEKEKMSDVKITLIFSAIVCGIITFFRLVHTIISSVIVKSYNWFSGSTTTKIVWENLGKLNWFEAIFKTFVGVALFMAGIAFLYYLGSLLIKKTTNYVKLLGMTVTACIPALLAIYLVSPIVSCIYAPIGVIVTILGLVYTILTLVRVIGNELHLKEKVEFYFHFISLSIICSAGYFIMVKMLTSNVTSALNGLSSLLR